VVTEILPLTPSDTIEACNLWSEYLQSLGPNMSEIITAWMKTDQIRQFLVQHAESNKGVVVRENGTMIAYMTYDRFLFHGEDTAFVPIAGHARIPGISDRIFQKMYGVVADALVEDHCINHILTLAVDDVELQRIVFQLGFGLYLVDAFKSSEMIYTPISVSESFSIRKATGRDVAAIHRLVVEFERYYRGSPLFLCRDPETVEEVEHLAVSDTGAIFVVETDKQIVGFCNVQIANESSPISLVHAGMGIIEPLGAYIRPEFRGQGIGAALVNEICRWCHERNISQIHVDFESANIEANVFWPRHFRPTLYSVKRRVNQDILGSSQYA
jgi:GNAT superfamily N-acetyltransferase